MPKVSIICRAYNQEKLITNAIKSVLNQTFEDFELLIINDASTDKTLSKIQEFKDTRIILMNNLKNLGALENLNTCLEMATGDYISILDGDDEYLPTKLEKQVDFLNNNLTYDAVFSYIGTIGDKNNPNVLISSELFEKMINNPQLSRGEMIRKCFSSKTFLAFPTEMFRKEVSCYWPNHLLGLGETNFHLNILFKSNIKVLEEILINYRVADDYTNKWCNSLSLKTELHFILDRFLEIDDVDFFKEIFKKDLENIDIPFEKNLLPYILTKIAEKEEDKIEWANYNLHRFIKDRKNYSLLIKNLNLNYCDFFKIKNGPSKSEKSDSEKSYRIEKKFGIFKKIKKNNGRRKIYFMGMKLISYRKK